MVDIEIGDRDVDTGISGSEELLAVDSVQGFVHITPDLLSAYIISNIEAIAAMTSPGSDDSFMMLENDNTLKPVTYEAIEDAIAETMYAESDIGTVAGADVFLVKDGAVTKGITTAASIATYMLTTIRTAVLTISNLDEIGSLVDTTEFLVDDSGVPKKTDFIDISDAVFGKLAAYLTAASAVVTTLDTDLLYLTQSGVEKQVTLAQIVSHFGSPITGSGAVDYMTRWSTASVLKGDILLVDSGTGFTTGSDTAIATTAAIAARLDAILLTGYETIWIPASAMMSSYTTGAESEIKEYGTNDVSTEPFLFDGSAQDESVEFEKVFPETWDLGTIKAKVFWSPGHADANTDEWVRFYLQARAYSDDDAIDAAYGTLQNMDDQAIADDDMHVTAASSAITITGTPALNDLIKFKLSRDWDYAGAGVAMDVDARVFGVLIQIRNSEEPVAW